MMLKIGSRVKCLKKNGKVFEGYIISKKKGNYMVMDIDDTLQCKEFPEDRVYYHGSGMARGEQTYLNIENICLNIRYRLINDYEEYYKNKTEEEDYKNNGIV